MFDELGNIKTVSVGNEAEPTDKPVQKTRYFGLFVLVLISLAFLATLLIHPYRRAEMFAREMLTRYAPSGTTATGISIGFPLNIVVTNLIVPVQVQEKQQQIAVNRLSGKISIIPLLRGTVDAGMNGDFFGGILWLDIKVDNLSSRQQDTPRILSFDARAREISIYELCAFAESPVLVSGLCNADVEGELDESDLATLMGRALIIGEDVEIPQFPIKGLIFPENSDVRFTAKLTARNGQILVEKMNLNGEAYRLSGNGSMVISDPPDISPVNGSFSMVFHEAPIVVDEKLVEAGADEIIRVLVDSGAKLFFNVTGTAGHLDVQLDSKTSLGSFLEQTRR